MSGSRSHQRLSRIKGDSIPWETRHGEGGTNRSRLRGLFTAYPKAGGCPPGPGRAGPRVPPDQPGRAEKKIRVPGIDILMRRRTLQSKANSFNPILGGHANGSFSRVSRSGTASPNSRPCPAHSQPTGRARQEDGGHTGPYECTNTAPPELRGAAQEPPSRDGSMRGADKAEVEKTARPVDLVSKASVQEPCPA